MSEHAIQFFSVAIIVVGIVSVALGLAHYRSRN